MKRFKKIKRYSLKQIIICIIISIVFITSLFLNTLASKSTDNILNINKELINTITTNIVNNNIKIDYLNKYKIEDLIVINYQNNKIVNIDYKLNDAYALLIDIKKNIILEINNHIKDYYHYDYDINDNMIVLSVPFYSYTNNIFLSNLGPKISVSLGMIRLIDGNVKTKVKTYGINALLIELYLNFTITSSIVIPNVRDNNIVNNYEILISSKVIEGEIPSLYNGYLESNSKVIES